MLNDLDIYNNNLKQKIIKNIKKTIKENSFIFGKNVSKIENKLSKYTGSKFVITVGSGTDALLLSLLSLNLKFGDKVIIPSFSWLSVLEVVLLLGLKPVFLDTDLKTFNLEVENLEKIIDKKTKVLISTSLFGRTVDLGEIRKICKKKNIILIEDAAQNFGSYVGKKNACNIADMTCTSFFPSKNLGCFGDGGAIFTNKKKYYDKLIKLRNHGQTNYNNGKIVGINSRLGSLQAGILIEKFKDFENKKKKQKLLYQQYIDFFSSKKIIGYPEIRNDKKYYDDMNSQFSILVKKRNILINELKKYKINYKIYYTKPLYKQYKLKKISSLKNTEYICKKIISLPFNDLSKKRFNFVIKALNKIISKNKGLFFEEK